METITEEQKAAERKQSLEAMRNARKHMDDAIKEIASLRDALNSAAQFIESSKKYIPREVYTYEGKMRVQDTFDAAAAAARKAL